MISNHFLFKELVHHPIETTTIKWMAMRFQVYLCLSNSLVPLLPPSKQPGLCWTLPQVYRRVVGRHGWMVQWSDFWCFNLLSGQFSPHFFSPPDFFLSFSCVFGSICLRHLFCWITEIFLKKMGAMLSLPDPMKSSSCFR